MLPCHVHPAMSPIKNALPAYDAPPLVEVVFGRQFDPLPLTVAHTGLLWERLDRKAYPDVQEQAPLPPVVEIYDGHAGPEIDIGEVLGFPRLWFTSREHDSLIQLQRDRLLVNWRAGMKPYPRYTTLFPKFQAVWATFETFVRAELDRAPSLRQLELTYVNHIPWASWPDLGAALRATFPDLAWRADSRFLVAPEGGEHRLTFRLPDKSGRLHVRFRDGRRTADGARIFILELTARGFLPDAPAWFEMAHDWIVRGFADLTSSEMQEKTWQRRP